MTQKYDFCVNINIFVVFNLITYILCNNECISVNNQEHDSHLSTKTPYRFVENLNVTPLNYPGCIPQRIWMIVRHGTRNPGKKYIKALDRLVEIQATFIKNLSNSKLCLEDINNLIKWKPPEDLIYKEKFLTYEGERELIELSKRMRKRLPLLFPETYSNASYQFKYTKNQRAEISAKSFAIGLFGDSDSKSVWFPEPLHKDPILRFYKCCDKWRYEVDKNPDTTLEKELFIRTDEVIEMINDITERLALPKDYLNFDDIFFMYSYCAFETAWKKYKIGAWCSAFTTSDFMILEYAEDLEYFWIDGYGYNLTHRQACVAIRDMLKHLQNEHKVPANFYFTHSGTILKIIAHLGLYQDSKPLTSEMQENRLWRVSLIDAFGSNLAFVKYSCGADHKPFLLLLHQERPVQIPGCPEDNLLCPMDKFIEWHSWNQKTCDFGEMCRMSKLDTCQYHLQWLLDQFYKCF